MILVYYALPAYQLHYSYTMFYTPSLGRYVCLHLRVYTTNDVYHKCLSYTAD